MAHCSFEPAIKWECVREIIQLLRTEETRERYLEVAKHAACFLGCGAEFLSGTVVPFAGEELDTAELSIEQIRDKLEAICPAGGAAAIDWNTILNVVMPILLELLKRR